MNLKKRKKKPFSDTRVWSNYRKAWASSVGAQGDSCHIVMSKLKILQILSECVILTILNSEHVHHFGLRETNLDQGSSFCTLQKNQWLQSKQPAALRLANRIADEQAFH